MDDEQFLLLLLAWSLTILALQNTHKDSQTEKKINKPEEKSISGHLTVTYSLENKRQSLSKR